MGLFTFLNKLKLRKNNNEKENVKFVTDSNLLDLYLKIEDSRPRFEDYLGRSINYPKYTDNYDTGTDFTLRELLLLVWYSRVKKGRLVSSTIPQYFFYDYNLNGKEITQKFLNQGLLTIKDNRYHLSDEAINIVSFYSSLWDLHRLSTYNFCLDEDFPNWNNGRLLKKCYEQEISYLREDIDTDNKLIWFYETYPSFLPDEEQRKNEIKNYNRSIEFSKNRIWDREEKIKALSQDSN